MSETFPKVKDMAEQVLAGDRRAAAKAISLCENGGQSPEAQALTAELWPHATGNVTVGITGPPGVGKSTLTAELVGHLRQQDLSVGVIAVDPSSSLTHGALLGDRVRMHEHFTDHDVFIRSMSSRGHLGGTAEATFLSMMVLDAAGKDITLVETVGVGQSEVEIRSLVDTVAVVLQPGSGDSIQAIKSGLLEIPDVLCLNKVDHPDADTTRRQLVTSLKRQTSEVQFVETVAAKSQGLDDFWNAVLAHREHLGEAGLLQRRREHLTEQLSAMALARLTPPLRQALQEQAGQQLLGQLEARTLDPLSALEQLLAASRQSGESS